MLVAWFLVSRVGKKHGGAGYTVLDMRHKHGAIGHPLADSSRNGDVISQIKALSGVLLGAKSVPVCIQLNDYSSFTR